MTKEDVYQIFKNDPWEPYSARDIQQELRAAGITLNIQTVYDKLRRLQKDKLIKKIRGDYIGIEGENEINTILQQSCERQLLENRKGTKGNKRPRTLQTRIYLFQRIFKRN